MKNLDKKSFRILNLSFFIAFFISIIVFMLFGFAPFGDKSLLIMDMNEQYSAFFNSLRDLSDEANILFSWNKSMGTENISLFSYYLSSPFNIIFLLFKSENFHYVLFFITALKIGIASLTFSLFLKSRFKFWDYRFILFSICYSLSSYVFDYSLCLMWIDGVIFLPIVLIGIDRILEDKKPTLLIFSFLALVLSNYYTSYMVYIFSVIYFAYRVFIEDAVLKDKILKKAIICLVSTILVAGMSMILILPSFLSLLENRLSYNVGSDNLFDFSLSLLFPNFLSGYYDSITDTGTASVYISILAIGFTISFFINSNIKLKEKIASALMIVFFILSFNVMPLIEFWHLFSHPSWFPARHAFVFGFFLLYIGAKSFFNIKQNKLNQSFLIAVVIVFIICTLIDNQNLIAINRVLVLIYALILLNVNKIKKANILLFIVLIFELVFNGYSQVKGLDNQFRYENEETYSNYHKSLSIVVEEMEKDDSFYRAEKDFERSKNDAIEFNYKGITHYSSVFKDSINQTLKSLGNPQSYFWNSYYGKNPITNALFSIKYEINKGNTASFYPNVFSQNGINLHQNPYTLNLISFASGDFNTSLTSNAFENSENILKSIYPYQDDVLKIFDLSLVSYTGEKISENQFKSNENIVLEYSLNLEKSGDVYLNLASYQYYTLYINDNIYTPTSEHTPSEGSVYIGEYLQGDKIDVKLVFNSNEIKINSAVFCIVNEELLKVITENINKNTTDLNIDGTDISAVITADTNGFLYTSIPYDKGWEIKINGEKVETTAYLNTFLSANLNKGENFVELSFSPIGLFEGSVISAIFLPLTIIYIKKYKWTKYFRRLNDTSKYIFKCNRHCDWCRR